jgi:hypothetical protein
VSSKITVLSKAARPGVLSASLLGHRKTGIPTPVKEDAQDHPAAISEAVSPNGENHGDVTVPSAPRGAVPENRGEAW